MKKISFYIILIVTLSLAFAGCSNNSSGSISMDTLKKLSLEYSPQDDIISPENSPSDQAAIIEEMFRVTSAKGFHAEIVPLAYTFYYTLEYDPAIERYRLDGYAECKCSIKKQAGCLICRSIPIKKFPSGKKFILCQRMKML